MDRKFSHAAKPNKTGFPKVVASSAAAATNSLFPASAVVVRLGKWSITVRWAETITLLLITVLAGVLLLKNLGDQCLWQDEAETACIAKTVLTNGFPHGGDGRNCFSQDLERDRLSPRHAWLSFYLAAGFFSVFGATALAARLPFALAGLACVPLCYYVARWLWQSRRAAALSAIVLATSVPFLILSRQCRYYSLTTLFSLLALLAYGHIVQRKRWAVPLFVVALVLLFHSNFVSWAVLLATVGIHVVIFHRDRFWALTLGATCSFLLNLPFLIWLVHFYAATPLAKDTEGATSVAVFAATAWDYVVRATPYLFPWPLLIVLIVIAVVILIRNQVRSRVNMAAWREPCLLLLYIVVDVAVFSLLYKFYFFRYLAPAIPLAAMLAGRILESAMRFNPVVGVVGLAAVLFFSPVQDYCYEITHHYRGPTEGIVEFLETHAKPDDVVVISYGDLPLKFYTNLRVVGGLTGEDMTPALKARWVIERKFTLCPKDAAVQQYLNSHLRVEDFRPHSIDYPDIPYDNRECPEEHRYRTVLGAPPITIWEKIAK